MKPRMEYIDHLLATKQITFDEHKRQIIRLSECYKAKVQEVLVLHSNTKD
jgi:hypothetical protein